MRDIIWMEFSLSQYIFFKLIMNIFLYTDYKENSLEILKDLNLDWSEAKQKRVDLKHAYATVSSNPKCHVLCFVLLIISIQHR